MPLPLAAQRLVIKAANGFKPLRPRDSHDILPLLIPLQNVSGERIKLLRGVPMFVYLPHAATLSILYMVCQASDDLKTAATSGSRTTATTFVPGRRCSFPPEFSRILSEHLYRVDEAFPRITARSFHTAPKDGIGDVTYTLSMSACAPWLVTSA